MPSPFAADGGSAAASSAASGEPSPAGSPGGRAAGDPAPAAASDSEPDTATLIEQLNQDRLWLLRQIDSGRWAEWRLDLAALERELGQLLEQARQRGLP